MPDRCDHYFTDEEHTANDQFTPAVRAPGRRRSCWTFDFAGGLSAFDGLPDDVNKGLEDPVLLGSVYFLLD